jgi:hypothetical protein
MALTSNTEVASYYIGPMSGGGGQRASRLRFPLLDGLDRAGEDLERSHAEHLNRYVCLQEYSIGHPLTLFLRAYSTAVCP